MSAQVSRSAANVVLPSICHRALQRLILTSTMLMECSSTQQLCFQQHNVRASSMPVDLMQYGVDNVCQRPTLGCMVALCGCRTQPGQQRLQDGLHVWGQHQIVGIQTHGSFTHPLQPCACLLLPQTMKTSAGPSSRLVQAYTAQGIMYWLSTGCNSQPCLRLSIQSTDSKSGQNAAYRAGCSLGLACQIGSIWRSWYGVWPSACSCRTELHERAPDRGPSRAGTQGTAARSGSTQGAPLRTVRPHPPASYPILVLAP